MPDNTLHTLNTDNTDNIISLKPICDYKSLSHISNIYKEKNDCAVITVAAIANIHYSEAHELFRKAGRRSKCGTPMHITRKVLSQLNLSLNDVTRYFSPSSVRTIAPQLPSQGKFVIRTHKHILAVVDGVVHDWSAQRKLYTKSVYRVESIPTDLDSYHENLVVTPSELRRETRIPCGEIDTSFPTKAVHAIAEVLFDPPSPFPSSPTNQKQWWSTFRAKVVAECVGHGINKTTASVQCGKWIQWYLSRLHLTSN